VSRYYESGRRHLREGVEYARSLPPVSYAIILSFWSLMVVLDSTNRDLVDEMRETVRRAESFGDICGIITAQFATVRRIARDDASRDEAVEVLERARANITSTR